MRRIAILDYLILAKWCYSIIMGKLIVGIYAFIQINLETPSYVD